MVYFDFVMEVELFKKACDEKDCNVFNFVSKERCGEEFAEFIEENKTKRTEGKDECLSIKCVESSSASSLLALGSWRSRDGEYNAENQIIRTPDTNMEIDGGVINIKKYDEGCNGRNVIFDMNIMSDELARIAVSIISKILEESRRRIGFVKCIKIEEEDKILYDRLWAFLLDSQKIIHLREIEMIQGLILLENVYNNHHGNENNFHSNFVDLIFYLATCLILAHKFNSDKPFTNAEWCDIGNMNVSTINACEAHTLWLLKYELWINEKDIENFIKQHGYKRKFVKSSSSYRNEQKIQI
jgi:hypothetical protein